MVKNTQIFPFLVLAAISMSASGQSMECQKAKRELSISTNIRTLSEADKRARMNMAIDQVNAACGTNIEKQKPSSDNFMVCTGSGSTMVCR